MMSLWDALRMNMMISYQELVRTFPNIIIEVPSCQIKITSDNSAPCHKQIRSEIINAAT
jgi:hypothetical protein